MSRQKPRMQHAVQPGTDAIVTTAKRIYGFKGSMAEIRAGAFNDEMRQAIIIAALRAGHSLTHTAAVIGYANTRLVMPYIGIRCRGALGMIVEEILEQARKYEIAEKAPAPESEPPDMAEMRKVIAAGDQKFARFFVSSI